MEPILGRTYSDKITGFKGICVGVVHYISGCNQAVLVPKLKADGSPVPGEWFDWQRLEEDTTVAQVILDNTAGPGFDSAPTRSTPPTR